LAEASLSSDGTKKHSSAHGQYGVKGAHRPSPLSMVENGRQVVPARPGSAMSGASYRMATSDVRGGDEEEDAESSRGVASQNYFKPGVSCSVRGLLDVY
jgi:hypothetical protein